MTIFVEFWLVRWAHWWWLVWSLMTTLELFVKKDNEVIILVVYLPIVSRISSVYYWRKLIRYYFLFVDWAYWRPLSRKSSWDLTTYFRFLLIFMNYLWFAWKVLLFKNIGLSLHLNINSLKQMNISENSRITNVNNCYKVYLEI